MAFVLCAGLITNIWRWFAVVAEDLRAIEKAKPLYSPNRFGIIVVDVVAVLYSGLIGTSQWPRLIRLKLEARATFSSPVIAYNYGLSSYRIIHSGVRVLWILCTRNIILKEKTQDYRISRFMPCQYFGFIWYFLAIIIHKPWVVVWKFYCNDCIRFPIDWWRVLFEIYRARIFVLKNAFPSKINWCKTDFSV